MNILEKIKSKKFLLLIIFLLVSVTLLLVFTKGDRGTPLLNYQNEKDTKLEGPFELSNTTSRYALTQSIVEKHTFFLSPDLAKFSAPDVVDYKGKFISIFAPGVSFISIPFYFLGKQLGLPQIFTFFTTAIFAIVNLFLVARLASKLGANRYTSILSGFVFLFATDALSYTLTVTQHHLSTSVILFAILNSLQKRNLLNDIIFGVLFGIGLLIDIPNAILLLPLLAYVISRHLEISIKDKIKIFIKLSLFGILLGLMPLVGIFAWYNYQTTGSFTKIGQSIGRTHLFRDNLPSQNKADSMIPEDTRGKPLLNLPFETRNQMGGLYTLLISDERSWLYYSPVLLLGILGLFVAHKNLKTSLSSKLAISVVSTNIVLYSMFGDPWGGWAFGPRYLIPSAAIMAASLGIVIQKFKKNPIFIMLFFVLFSYSVFVSALGAVTTNAVAPKIEAVNLKPAISYTYKYNLNFVEQNRSSNLLYNVLLKDKISLNVYLYILTASIIAIALMIYRFLLLAKEDSDE